MDLYVKMVWYNPPAASRGGVSSIVWHRIRPPMVQLPPRLLFHNLVALDSSPSLRRQSIFYTETPMIAFFGQQFGPSHCLRRCGSSFTTTPFVSTMVGLCLEFLSTSCGCVDKKPARHLAVETNPDLPFAMLGRIARFSNLPTFRISRVFEFIGN